MLNLTQLLSCHNVSPRYPRRNTAVIVWNITQLCNLDCVFCYYDAKKNLNSKGSLDFKLAEHIVEQLRQARIKFVLLSGGGAAALPKDF